MGWVTKKKYAWMRGGIVGCYLPGNINSYVCCTQDGKKWIVLRGGLCWTLITGSFDAMRRLNADEARNYGEALVKFKLML